jgi:MFS transporter, CP family, cyanate transporter
VSQSPIAASTSSRDPDGTSLTGRGAAVLAGVGIILVAANLRPAVVAVAPLVDEIKASTGWNSSVTGLLTTLPVLVFGLTAPAAPRCAARFGMERTVFGALAVLIAGIVLRLVPEAAGLFAGSVLVGAGIGICNVVLPSLIKRDFAHRSGLMTGLYSATLSAGAAVASGSVVPINDAIGGNWRVTLALWMIPALAATLVWVPQLRRMHRAELTKSREPLWRNRMAWAITIFMAAQSMIFYAFAAWLPEFLIDRGMTPAHAGAVLALSQLAGMAASLIAPIIAVRFRDQRIFTAITMIGCAIGFVGLLTTERWPTLWAMCVMTGPGAGIGLALLFMVLRSTSTAQTGQVSGMAQCAGYLLAALGPVGVGVLHDVTGSWTLAMSALGLVLIPQVLSTWLAARDDTMTPARVF